MRIGVVVAGGASKRMGREKALVRAHGETFVAHVVRRLWTACDVVVVVLGAHARKIRPAIEAEFESLVKSGRLHDDRTQPVRTWGRSPATRTRVRGQHGVV